MTEALKNALENHAPTGSPHYDSEQQGFVYKRAEDGSVALAFIIKELTQHELVMVCSTYSIWFYHKGKKLFDEFERFKEKASWNKLAKMKDENALALESARAWAEAGKQ